MTRLRAVFALSLAAITLSACVSGPLAPEPASGEPTFRVRADFAAPLNADAGWAGAPGETVAVTADQPFRLRLEAPLGPQAATLALEARRNEGDWARLEAHDFPYPERAVSPAFDDTVLEDWTVLDGAPDQLRVASGGDERVLRLDGGADGLAAIYETPWGPSADVAIEARLRLHDEDGFLDLLFGAHAATRHAVRFHADGRVNVLNGEAVLAEAASSFAAGDWLGIELAYEAGLLEIEVEGEAVFEGRLSAPSGAPGLAVPQGGRVDIAEITFEGVASTPQASIVSTNAYEPGAPTEDVLDGAAGPFTPGAGVSLSERASAPGRVGGHIEYEWPLVIRRLADGPTVSEDGDVFAFRMVEAETGAAAGPVARVALSVPPGHLGGTFVETPGRIGPWRASSGDLYFIMEPSETDNKFMMMKSVDGGRTWREADGANRPLTGDLEAVDARLVEDRIHIIHQVTESVRHHVFLTSDHPEAPDSWAICDELAADATAIAQMATLAARSDGSLVTVFLADRLHYAVRSPGGDWSAPAVLDPEAEAITVGPQAVRGRGDVVHIAYSGDDGRIWLRRLFADGRLGDRTLVATGAGTGRAAYGAVLPLVYDADTDTLTLAYRLADGSLWSRRFGGGEPASAPSRVTPGPVVTDAVDSQQAGADLIQAGERLVVLFIDEETRSLFSTVQTGQGWSEPVLRAGGIDAAWVRGAALPSPGGAPVIGYVYDAGSQGGTGLNRFDRWDLSASAGEASTPAPNPN